MTKYPMAGKLQRELATNELTANPYDVYSSTGLEQTFGSEDAANAYADEIRGAGATRVAVRKRAVKLKPPRPPGAPPMYHAPRGLPPGVPNPKCDHAALKRDPKLWSQCKLVGLQVTPADDTGPEETLELRNCKHCGTTLAIDVTPKGNPMRKRKNAEETHDTDILGGMESCIWVMAWANWVEEQPDAKRKRLRPPGCNLEDYAPPAPASALLAAEDLYAMIERANGKTPGELLERAAKADGMQPGQITDAYAELFGHYLAMQQMDEGTSWFDYHAEFPLKFGQHFEAHSFDGKTVDWSPRGSKGGRQ